MSYYEKFALTLDVSSSTSIRNICGSKDHMTANPQVLCMLTIISHQFI